MKRPLLIGIHGKARSGKDTVADFIVAAQGGYKYSFASPVKRMLAQLGIDLERDPYWTTHKEDVIPALGVSPRRLMQTLGTEWGRNMISLDLWVTMAKVRLMNGGPGMVVADVRFENEAQWVRDQGGRVIHVVRPEGKEVEAHSSEDGVQRHPDDIELLNNGTLEDLQEAVRRLLDVDQT